MNVADALTAEHGVFHLLIEQLEDAAARCRTVDELRSAAAPLAISLLAHARVEEETLFTPLERQIGEAGPLHCLREEHEAMDLQLRALFREPDLEATRRAVHEVLAAARRHLGVEEETLFTPLERQIGEAGPLHCLREEHEAMDLQLRALFREPDLEATRRAVHEVLAAARRHLGKEEQVLFQVARKALQDDDLQKLGAHWARARGITLGD